MFLEIPPLDQLRASSSGLWLSWRKAENFLPRGVNLSLGDSQEPPESSVMSKRCLPPLGQVSAIQHRAVEEAFTQGAVPGWVAVGVAQK